MTEYRELCGGHYFAVDFVYGNKVVEFDGRYWHSLEEVIKKDKIKTKLLQNDGYEVLRIAENDYREDPLRVIKECIRFLKGEEV